MSTDPDQIRRDIERTREELRSDVDALTDKVSPRRVVAQRVDQVRGAWQNMTDKVMGSTSQAGSTVVDSVSSAASAVGDAAGTAQEKVRRQTQGSPLAVGLIAFGAGVVISSLLPPSRAEQQVAGQVKEKLSEQSEAIKERVTEAATEMKGNLSEPAKEAMDSVKSAATDAAGTVRDDAGSAMKDTQAGSAMRDTEAGDGVYRSAAA